MRSKVILIISILLVMSMTLQTNLTVFAQNTPSSNTTNKQNSIISGNLTGSVNSNMNAFVLNQDAVEVTTTPTPVTPPLSEVGKYDDRSPNLIYSGTWVQQGISNLYSGTESYSTSIGSSVNMKFRGGSVSFFYRQHTFFGEVRVAIDGNDVAVINQYNASEIRNVSWTSGEVDPNTIHTLTLTHISGKYMSMDAVAINDPAQVTPTDGPADPTAVPSTQQPTTQPTTAVQATNPPSVGYGTYDDYVKDIVYTGTWAGQALNGNYAKTEHFSAKIGSTATFTFTGENISVLYRGYPSYFGDMEVKIDGAVVGTINQNTTTITYQNRWTSGNLGAGTHTMVLTHKTGVYVSLDAITVSGPPSATPISTQTFTPTKTTAPASTQTPLPPVGYGTYDDYVEDIVYTGKWYGQALNGNYAKTEHFSAKIGSTASFTFTGENISVLYRGYPGYFGDMEVKIDGAVVGTINQNTTTVTYQNRWTSGNLGAGTHTMVLTHKTGVYVSLDAITVSGPPSVTPISTQTFTSTKTATPASSQTPLPSVFGYGTYDDYVKDIVYAGSWFAQALNGNYAKTEHYSAKIGSTASFTFTGESISVLYRGYPGYFGNMEVKIDGAVVGTINQNTTTVTYQNRWTSGNLGAGTHTMVLTHKTGVYVSLDAITVSGPPSATPTKTNTSAPTKTATSAPTKTNTSTPTKTATSASRLPVGYGTYDDYVEDIVYAGTWYGQALNGNYAKTEHYSSKIGSTASFTFTGESISVVYRGYPGYFGNMEVKIDGAVVGTINQNTSTITYQNRWTSGNLGAGTHTMVLTHKTGTYVSLDAITVSAPPTPTPTKTNTSTPTKTAIATNTPIASITPTPGSVGMYYVDSIAGSDSNSGTSISAPWKSLAAITSRKFNPGSIISFKRGSSYTGTFNIDDSGTAANPIVFTAYGSGASPVFQNPGSNTNKTRGITVNADYIIIENVKVTNTQDAGVYINNGSDYVTIRNSEISNTGIGVTMRGASDKVLNNHIHDLHMVNNTVGGDDDYGANGILVSGTSINGEIAYNRFINCKATSYDYGVDGGTIEYYGTISGYNIHHNYAENNQGFLEIGSGATGAVSNTIVAYNVMYNNARPLGVHLSGTFGVTVSGLRFENNTVVDLQTNNSTIAINFYSDVPTASTLIMKNNVFYLTNYTKVASASTFTHSHNLFFFNGKATTLGFTLGTGESIANPAFVNLAGKDFKLTSSSPAINKGTTTLFSTDYNGYTVPSGGTPDIGAHEYQQ